MGVCRSTATRHGITPALILVGVYIYNFVRHYFNSAQQNDQKGMIAATPNGTMLI